MANSRNRVATDETPDTKTETPNAKTEEIIDPWADVATETVDEPLPADVAVPPTILHAVVRALDEGPQVQIIDGWSEEKINAFVKFVRLAKGPLVLTYVSCKPVLRGGKKALRITASRKPRAPRSTNSAPVSTEPAV